MMNKTIIALALLCGVAVTAGAQTPLRANRVPSQGVTTVVSGPRDSVSTVSRVLQENAPVTPADAALPRFAIVGKDRLFYLGIGAQLLSEGVFTWGDDMPSAYNFTPSSLERATAGNGGDLGFAWQSSGIHFNFVALPGTRDQIGLYFKAGFNASGGMKCSHLYIRYRGLTAGYTNSAFTDGAAMPFTIDNEGPNGYPSMKLFNIYWTQKLPYGLSAAIGVDAPSADMTYGKYTADVNQRIPAVPVYVQYGYNGGDDHIRLSALVRPMQYRDTQSGSNRTPVGAGVQLSGITTLGGPVSLLYNVAYGRGIGTYLQDDNGIGLDATPSLDEGRMALVRNLGVTAGLNMSITPNVSANVCYSHLTNWLGSHAAPQPGLYRDGDYVAANVVYNLNKFVAVGMEYDYGHMNTFGDAPLHANRLQAQLALTF